MAKDSSIVNELAEYLVDVRNLGKKEMDLEVLHAVCDFIELDRGNRGSSLLKINTNSEKNHNKFD